MSKGYSGNSDFDFDIERFKNIKTGELVKEEEVENINDFEQVNITLYVKGNSHYYPGEYLKSPEDCYPDDKDVEIESIMDINYNNWICKLTNFEKEAILEKIDYNSRDDYDYEYEYNYDYGY